jgi:RNA polymerase sigma factor (TIGR02999 family)
VWVKQEAALTGLLGAWNRGDTDALEQLARLVHQELRALARRILACERQGNALQPTELINEAYLRLLDWRTVRWQNRAHFFATVAGMMRRVLVDAARSRQAAKRGASEEGLSLDNAQSVAVSSPVDVVALSDALDSLATLNPRPSQVVEMRFFGGFTVEETAEALGVSVRTVINDWNTARAWLYLELTRQGRP